MSSLIIFDGEMLLRSSHPHLSTGILLASDSDDAVSKPWSFILKAVNYIFTMSDSDITDPLLPTISDVEEPLRAHNSTTHPDLEVFPSWKQLKAQLSPVVLATGTRDTKWRLGIYGSRSTQAHVLHRDQGWIVTLDDFRDYAGYHLPGWDEREARIRASAAPGDPFDELNYRPPDDSQMVYITRQIGTESGNVEYKTVHGYLSLEEGRYPDSKEGRITRLTTKLNDMIRPSAPPSTWGTVASLQRGESSSGKGKGKMPVGTTIAQESEGVFADIEPYLADIAKMLIEHVETVLPMPTPGGETTNTEEGRGTDSGDARINVDSQTTQTGI